jgi:replicative DNA helicase
MKADEFLPESDYLETILETRDRLVSGRIPLGNAFLDDALGGLYPDDLVILGAAPGVGKTALVTSTVKAALVHGVEDVRLFALEATPGEIGARMAFEELAKRSPSSLDFADFWRGRTAAQEGEHWKSVMKDLSPMLSRLHTLYKSRGDFTNATLAKHLAGIPSDCRLVACDHIHVVDGADGAENSTQRKTVGLLRDLALDRNTPVLAASHIRKSTGGEARKLVPGMDDLLGSKHIAGVATVIVTVAPDREGGSQRHLFPTFFSVEKDRRGRASTLVARMNYDKYRGTYQDQYTLGRVVWKDRGQAFEPVPEKYIPQWAKREVRNIEGKPF